MNKRSASDSDDGAPPAPKRPKQTAPTDEMLLSTALRNTQVVVPMNTLLHQLGVTLAGGRVKKVKPISSDCVQVRPTSIVPAHLRDQPVFLSWLYDTQDTASLQLATVRTAIMEAFGTFTVDRAHGTTSLTVPSILLDQRVGKLKHASNTMPAFREVHDDSIRQIAAMSIIVPTLAQVLKTVLANDRPRRGDVDQDEYESDGIDDDEQPDAAFTDESSFKDSSEDES